MEWVVWYGIVLIILVGIIIWLVICFIDMKKDRNNWSEKLEEANARVEILYEKNEVLSAKVDMYREQIITLTNKKHTLTKAELEQQLAGINYKEKWPLCHAIKNNGVAFVDFYVLGKSIGKYTNKGAVEFSKKYIKQTDWVEIGKWGIRDSAYEVKKIRKERE